MTDAPARPATILIVDDQEPNVRVLERILERAGYDRIISTTDPRQAVDLFARYRPDLVLLDLHMPYLDGFGVLEQLGPTLREHAYLPVLVLTADISSAAKRRALSMGAKDFLAKPFDSIEVLLRIRNLLETRFLYLELQDQNAHLEEKVRERTEQLEHAQVEILDRLALAAEFRDDATHEHTRRVGELSARIASQLGLPEREVELLRLAAPLHDVGKIAVPDKILLKFDHLSDGDFEVLKAHTTIGARILAGSDHPLLQLAEQIASTHHARWDGRGYPPGVAGEAIPLVSRIVAVADVFDALTHDRPYKDAWSVGDAVDEIRRERGRQFDPRVVDAFVDLLHSDGLLAPDESPESG